MPEERFSYSCWTAKTISFGDGSWGANARRMPSSMPSSPSSPICLPECRMPTHAHHLVFVVFITAVGCLLISDLSRFWRYVLLLSAVLETLNGFHRIRDFRPFSLDCDGSGCFCVNEGSGPMPISGMRWQDFGYLAVLHYCREGQPRSAVWWLVGMPEPQRRQLRLWMNAPATGKPKELPSVLVNPVI